MVSMMVMTKDHKPYITGKERGKWFSILGDLKPNTFVTCDKDNIGRARYALYQLYNNPLERESIKVADNEYQLWRYEIEKPRKVPLTASIAHARQKR